VGVSLDRVGLLVVGLMGPVLSCAVSLGSFVVVVVGWIYIPYTLSASVWRLRGGCTLYCLCSFFMKQVWSIGVVRIILLHFADWAFLLHHLKSGPHH
jgi:hypothetical protein